MTANLPFKCAGATVPCTCPYCIKHPGTPRHQLVFVLPDEVRVLCLAQTHNPCEIDRGGSSYEIEVLTNCHGLGWTPATNGWEEAAVAAGAIVVLSGWDLMNKQWWASVEFPRSVVQRVHGKVPSSVRITALYRALEAMGATFPEVEDASH